MRKAILYQRAFDDSIPICTFKEALNGFRKAGNPHYESITLNFIGTLFVLSNSDSAEYYISQSISLSKMANDSIATADALTSLCSLYYNLENYKQVTCHAYETVVVYGRFLENRACNDFASISFAKTNSIDSAYWYYNYAPPANNTEDTISMLRAKAEIALAEGDHHAYIKLNQLAVDLADSVLLAGQADKLREAELKYEKAETKIEYLSKQKRLILFIAILVVVIICIACIAVLLRQKLQYAHQEINDAVEQLNNMKKQIEQQTTENKKYIQRIQEQEIKLQETQCSPKTSDISLQPLSELIIIQEITKSCIDEILRCVFYNGKHKSDGIIGNDVPITVSEEFWEKLDEIVSLKHRDVIDRLEKQNNPLSKIEKRVFALCSINMPNAIIRRILNYKNVQIVSNYRHRLAVKILGDGHKLEEII